MALKSETLTTPDGVANITHTESGNEEDLEDGEIFDDEEPTGEELLQGGGPHFESSTPFEEDRKERKPDYSTSSLITSIPRGIDRRPNNDHRPDREKRLQKRRKRDRDDDLEEEDLDIDRKSNKTRRNKEPDKMRPGEEDMDEMEMLGMRGGNSPVMRQNDPQWEKYDSFDEEGDEGRGDQMRNDRRRRREGFNSTNRAARRGRRGRGGGVANKRRVVRDRDFTMCKYYLQGNCQRANDCPYSHNSLPQKKMEVCKFYMMDCCAKKDKCNFMHSEFPCRYYHSGQKCYAGKKCKFSHGKISIHLKRALQMHCQSSPKDEFGTRYNNRDKEGVNMPSPPIHNERHNDHREDYRHMGDRNERYHNDRHGGEYHHNDRNRGPPRSDEPRGNRDGGGYHRNNDPPDRLIMGRQDVDLRDKSIPSLLDIKVPNPDAEHEDDGSHTPMPSSPQESDKDFDNNKEANSSGKRERKDSSGSCEDSGDLPIHLPKKQRELYLRIQQQQRDAEDTLKEGGDEGAREDEYKDENWYSSDEESVNNSNMDPINPLSAILRSLREAKNKSEDKQVPTVSPALIDIDVSAVSKILSSVRETIQQKTEGKDHSPPHDEQSKAPAPKQEERRNRDPRLRSVSVDKKQPGTSNESTSAVPLDMDMRLGGSLSSTTSGDVDLRHLPFKPAPMHQAAKEIDASVSSHPPIEWKPTLYTLPKPDYSNIKPTTPNDPRLRRFISAAPQQASIQPQTLQQPQQPLLSPTQPGPQSNAPGSQPDYLSRDPRARNKNLPLAADPRRKSVLLNPSSSSLPPPQVGGPGIPPPRFDEPVQSHMGPPMNMMGPGRDSDFRYPMPMMDGPPHGVGMHGGPPMQHHPPMNAPYMGFPQHRHNDIDLRVNSHYNYK